MKQIGFRCLVYKEEEGDFFTGVCLDLDIVEEGHKTLEESILSINEAINSHLQAAAKAKFPKELMFRPAPKIYWNKAKDVLQEKSPKLSITPFRFYTTQSSCPPQIYA